MSQSNKQVAAVGGFILLIGSSSSSGDVGTSSHDITAVYKANPSASCFIAAITSLFINRFFGKKWSLFVAINVALAGMVSCPMARQKQNICTFYQSL